MTYSGKRVLVTGGGSGSGCAAATAGDRAMRKQATHLRARIPAYGRRPVGQVSADDGNS